MSAVIAYADRVSAAYRFADQRTPAHLVPDTPDGIFYKQVPNVIAWITNSIADKAAGADLYSQSGHDLRIGAREKLFELLSNGIGNFPFSTVAALGGWRNTLKWLLEKRIFTWNKEVPPDSFGPVTILETVPMPVQRRALDAYSISPGLAFAYLGMAPDASNTMSYAMLPGRVQQAYYHAEYGIVFNEAFRDAIVTALGGMVERQVGGIAWREDRFWNLDRLLAWGRTYSSGVAPAIVCDGGVCSVGTVGQQVQTGFAGVLCFPGHASGGDCTTHEDFWAEYHVEPWRAFPWITSAFHQPRVIYAPLNDIAGKARSARRKADVMGFVEAIAIFFAVTGLGTALVTIIQSGATLATSANLVVAVDRIPGVDFGFAGKVLALANGNLDLDAFSVEAGLSSLDFEAALAPPIEAIPMYEFDLPEIEIPAFDLPIYEGAGAFDFGADAWSDMPEFDLGWNNETPWSDPFGGSSDDALFADLGIQPFDSGITSLAENSGGWFDGFSMSDVPLKFITDLGAMYLQYDLGKQQIEAQQGRALPPARPTPGTSGRLPDGSTYTVNPNGSTTVRSPDGQVRTVNPSGQVVTGVPRGANTPMGSLIPGVSNTVLIAGAVGIGALVLLAKKK